MVILWGIRAVSSVGRAIRLHRKGRGFESLTAHQTKHTLGACVFTYVGTRGLEPPFPCENYDLNVARLPIPPRARTARIPER